MSKIHIHEWRQLNSVTPQFDILVSKYANLIGSIFYIIILRPSLVNKQLKPTKSPQIIEWPGYKTFT